MRGAGKREVVFIGSVRDDFGSFESFEKGRRKRGGGRSWKSNCFGFIGLLRIPSFFLLLRKLSGKRIFAARDKKNLSEKFDLKIIKKFRHHYPKKSRKKDKELIEKSENKVKISLPRATDV